MNPKMQLLANRYAQAFIAAFPTFITKEQVHNLHSCIQSIRERSHVMFYLKISCIPEQTRIKRFLSFLGDYNLRTQEIHRLIELLAQKKRLFLITMVFEQLIALYKKNHNIVDFTVQTSCTLTPQEKNTLEKFLTYQTRKHIVCTYRTDTSLIAGIRALSTSWLWERSIRKKLRTIKRTYL